MKRISLLPVAKALRRSLVLVLPAALLVVAIANFVSSGGRPAIVGGTHAATLSPLAQQVDQLAVDVAAIHGDKAPSQVTWVSTTLGAAQNVLSGDEVSGSTTPVYAIEITGGTFTAHVRGNPRGTTLWVVMDEATWKGLGIGLQDTTPSMSALGTVETDSLVGITPTSPSSWFSKYHVARSTATNGHPSAK